VTDGTRPQPEDAVNAESDARARVKGAMPEGEKAPDAGTKPETLGGSQPAV
jgi:hypothetical protein